MGDLIELQPREAGGGGGITREDFIAGIASDIESKQPALFDLNKLRKDLEADGFSPVFVVLVQELERWEKLNLRMSKSLSQLKKALVGEIALSTELDALGSSLFNGQLPMMWRKLTPQTDKSWVRGSPSTWRHASTDWVKRVSPRSCGCPGSPFRRRHAALVQTRAATVAAR